MKNTINIYLFTFKQLMKTLAIFLVIPYAILLINIIISFLFTGSLSSDQVQISGFDYISFIVWVIAISAIFKSTFSMASENNVSRKEIIMANCATIITGAIIWATIASFIMPIIYNLSFLNNLSVYDISLLSVFELIYDVNTGIAFIIVILTFLTLGFMAWMISSIQTFLPKFGRVLLAIGIIILTFSFFIAFSVILANNLSNTNIVDYSNAPILIRFFMTLATYFVTTSSVYIAHIVSSVIFLVLSIFFTTKQKGLPLK